MTYNYTIRLNQNEQFLLFNDHGHAIPIMDLISTLNPHRVIAFVASMGTGKTTLIKQLCNALRTTDVVNSPTFAIVNVYETPTDEIYHMDCYRLKNIREAQDMGMEEYLYSQHWCFIEWPEIIQPILPDDTVFITMHKTATNDRTITFEL